MVKCCRAAFLSLLFAVLLQLSSALRPALDVVDRQYEDHATSVKALALEEANNSAAAIEVASGKVEHSDSDSYTSGYFPAQTCLYIVQASTVGSEVGEDGGIITAGDVAFTEVADAMKRWAADAIFLTHIVETGTVFVAPTRGAMGTALVYLAQYLLWYSITTYTRGYEAMGDRKPWSGTEAPWKETRHARFAVISEMRPIRRWPNIRKERDPPEVPEIDFVATRGEDGDYVGKVSEQGAVARPVLEGLEDYLNDIAEKALAKVKNDFKKQDTEPAAAKEIMAEKVTELIDTFKALYDQEQPMEDKEDDMDEDVPIPNWEHPLQPQGNAKEVFRSVHDLKLTLWKYEWAGRKFGAKRVVLIGDPVKAAWMFPSVVGDDATQINKVTMQWVLPLPGPLALIDAKWDVLPKYSTPLSIQNLYMRPEFGDILQLGADFLAEGKSVPFFSHIELMADLADTPWTPPKLRTESSYVPVLFDDWDYVLPEQTDLGAVDHDFAIFMSDTAVSNALPAKQSDRNVLPTNARYASYLMSVMKQSHGTSWERAIVRIAYHHFPGDEPQAYLTVMDEFGERIHKTMLLSQCAAVQKRLPEEDEDGIDDSVSSTDDGVDHSVSLTVDSDDGEKKKKFKDRDPTTWWIELTYTESQAKTRRYKLTPLPLPGVWLPNWESVRRKSLKPENQLPYKVFDTEKPTDDFMYDFNQAKDILL